jgi:branched-chain amino acid aminotransferase
LSRPEPHARPEIVMSSDSRPDFRHIAHPSPVPSAERAQKLVDPGFGRVFTDHMVVVRWSDERGWHDGEVRARAPFQIDPASAVLHYAQEIFEGLKAYRHGNGVALFRPERNAQRFQDSAERLAMPAVPESLFLSAIEEIIRIDRDWIPDGEGSLYLRPFMFANETFLGVKPASEYLFVVIASPVGSYFKGGKKAVTVWLSDNYTRAAPGGTGAAKCGGNYAASLVAQAEALKQGCDQVVFLDAAEHKWVEELGGMNVFFVFDDGSMLTPPLGGTILPGVTRDSVLTLARADGRTVREARYSIEEWRADAASGRLRECFACGTAAVVSPIGKIKSSKGDFAIGEGDGGPITEGLKAKLVGIQRGEIADERGWVRRVL